MTTCRRVAPDVWLGFARSTAGLGPIPRAQRWACDRAAADRAVAAVLEASGYRRDACATSRSHTRGMAAAVVAPAGVRVGVDLVEIGRVGRRHAEAIASTEEWEALAPHAEVRPALAWALKEAAAKAAATRAGEPIHCFPHGLRIVGAAPGLPLVVRSGWMVFTAEWSLMGGFLCAWVRGARGSSPRSSVMPMVAWGNGTGTAMAEAVRRHYGSAEA